MSAHEVDLALRHGVLLEQQSPCWVAIDGGVVHAVGRETVESPPSARRTRDLGGALAIPGLISAHHHSMDRSARGSPIGGTFPEWLLDVYYRTALSLDPADAAESARRTAAEATMSGITTVVDCWGVGDLGSARAFEAASATVEAYRSVGIRLVLAVMIGDIEPTWLAGTAADRSVTTRMVADTDATLGFVARLIELHHDPVGGVEIWPAPELPEMASDRLWEGCVELARRHGLRISTHLNASEPGAWTGPDKRERTIARLARLDALDFLIGAHGTHLDQSDIAALGASGCGIVHCPSASLALASPPTPVTQLRAADVACAIGIDNPSLTATADLFAEVRLAAGLARLREADQAALSMEDAFVLAMEGGSDVLGRPAIGRLGVGSVADVIVIDRSGDHWWPRHPARTALAHQARLDDIVEVIVAGRTIRRRTTSG